MRNYICTPFMNFAYIYFVSLYTVATKKKLRGYAKNTNVYYLYDYFYNNTLNGTYRTRE